MQGEVHIDRLKSRTILSPAWSLGNISSWDYHGLAASDVDGNVYDAGYIEPDNMYSHPTIHKFDARGGIVFASKVSDGSASIHVRRISVTDDAGSFEIEVHLDSPDPVPIHHLATGEPSGHSMTRPGVVSYTPGGYVSSIRDGYDASEIDVVVDIPGEIDGYVVTRLAGMDSDTDERSIYVTAHATKHDIDFAMLIKFDACDGHRIMGYSVIPGRSTTNLVRVDSDRDAGIVNWVTDYRGADCTQDLITDHIDLDRDECALLVAHGCGGEPLTSFIVVMFDIASGRVIHTETAARTSLSQMAFHDSQDKLESDWSEKVRAMDEKIQKEMCDLDIDKISMEIMKMSQTAT